jgi:phosphoglycolate phosphatase
MGCPLQICCRIGRALCDAQPRIARFRPAIRGKIVRLFAAHAGCGTQSGMSATLLIVDLDGTLVDSVPDLTQALNRVLAEHGYAPLTPAEVAPMVGDGVPVLVERGFAARGGSTTEAAEALPRYIAIYEDHATDLTRPYPGVPETLTALRRRGYRTAICTNKLQRASETVLEGLGLAALFDAVAGGDRYEVKKPDKGHLLGLIAELGGTAERAVMIGDSENDAAVAHAAAVPLVIMRYGYARLAPETLGAQAVLDSFSELPSALERFGLGP